MSERNDGGRPGREDRPGRQDRPGGRDQGRPQRSGGQVRGGRSGGAGGPGGRSAGGGSGHRDDEWSRDDRARGPRREDGGDGPPGGSRDDRGRRDSRDSRDFRGGSRDDRGGRDGRPPRGGRDRQGEAPERRGGSRLTPKGPRLPEPAIEPGITGKELDRDVRGQLRTLSVENAEGVAQHLVMVAIRLAEENLDAALAHAEVAVRRAGRVPAAREALGTVAYRMGDFARALTEFRTVRRLSGSSHVLPLMVDCERGLGRHDRALELAATPEARTLSEAEKVELLIVVSGIRRDLGQLDAAVVGLEGPQLRRKGRAPWQPRLWYAYADALLARGDAEQARDWFAKAAAADTELETDAAERLEELDGTSFVDLLEDDDDEDEGAEADADRAADDR